MTSKQNAKKVSTILTALFLVLALTAGCAGNNDSDSVTLVILQTSDVHHHATGYGPQSDYTPLDSSDNDSVKGGYARLAGLIKEIRSDAAKISRPVLLFDSGDFLMGTIYDLTAADPIAFEYMETMGYDAVTLGNHEFDWGASALAGLINAAMNSGFNVPIVATNMVTDPSDSGDDDIEALVNAGAITGSRIITVRGGLKVGVLGILGIGAYAVAPLTAPITFNEEYAFLQGRVDALRAEGAALVVLLSHTGVLTDGSGEDADIAANVTGIDIIASGHTHTATTTEFVDGPSNTIIFAPGEYGSYLSRLEITYNKKQKKITSYDFALLPVDDTVAGDRDMDALVTGYQPVINAALSDLGVQADTLISGTTFDLTKVPFQETGFGDLAADAIRMAAGDLDTADPAPYDVGVIASGVIRDNLYQGKSSNLIFSDVYNALPLGISPYGDTSPGYPMMSLYLTAAELRNVCEISVSAAPVMGEDYYLNLSGIRYDYDAAGSFLEKVTNVYLCDASDTHTVTAGTLLNLNDTTTLYHVVVNLYALSMMDLATSVGLPIVPKDRNGVTVSSADYPNMRVDISTADGVQELKEWMALKYFLETDYPSSGAGIPEEIYGPGGTGLGRAHAVGE